MDTQLRSEEPAAYTSARLWCVVWMTLFVCVGCACSNEDAQPEDDGEHAPEPSPFDFEGEPPSGSEDHTEASTPSSKDTHAPSNTSAKTPPRTEGASSDTGGIDPSVQQTKGPNLPLPPQTRPKPAPFPPRTRPKPAPRPAGHDGCRTRGQACVCGNTGWRGTCQTGPHKSGLYCRCD